MPIVFWASLEPWAKAMNPAENTWSLRKMRPQRLAGEVAEDPAQRDHEDERDGEAEDRRA